LPVLTAKEYSEKQKEIKQERQGIQSPVNPIETDKKIKEYILFYPENVIDNHANMELKVKINDEIKSFRIINGMVRSKDEILAKYLISIGYHVIDIMED
jgi:hypothetical protein